MNTICFFGIYDPAYSRNRVLIRGFEKNGYEVIKCRVDPKKVRGWRKYWQLYRQQQQLRHKQFTYVIVAFPGHTVVWLARLLFGRRIIFDAFLSLYDSNVCDRKLYPRFNPLAWRDWLLDWSGCRLAWKILLDTNQHIDYFVTTFCLPRSKFIRVLIGADETIFCPQPDLANTNFASLVVHFHGMFIPLQGIKYIIDAATHLRDTPVYFRIVGKGQDYELMRQYATEHNLQHKIEFLGARLLEEIPKDIAKADICLGIFGDTRKAQRVIPNKVYECIAMAKPVITADTPALREVFTDKENVLCCKAADGKDLAAKITQLINNPEMRKNIAEEGFKLFRSKLTARQLVAHLLTALAI